MSAGIAGLWRSALHALGVGRPAETLPPRPRDRYLVRSLHLVPWSSRMRFGWVVAWDGPWWHNAVGVAGADWDGGRWLGGMSWRRHGPFVVCRYRRRGSWRCDRQMAQAEKELDALYGDLMPEARA